VFSFFYGRKEDFIKCSSILAFIRSTKDSPYEYCLIDLKLNLFVDTCDFVKNKNVLLKAKKGEVFIS
jgi:hypothetical protein